MLRLGTHTHRPLMVTSLDSRVRASLYLCGGVHVCMLVFETHTHIVSLSWHQL